MTRSSGRFVSQTSFTPSAKSCGLGEPTCCHSRYACDKQTPRPLGQDGDPGGQVGRLGVARGRLALAVEPRGRGADAADRVALHQQRVHRESGEEVDPQLLGPLAQPADDLAERCRVVALLCIVGGVGIRCARPLRQESRPTRPRLAGGRESRRVVSSGKSSWKARGLTTAPERLCSPRLSAFSSTAMLRSAMPPPACWSCLTKPRQLDGAGESRRPGAHDEHVHLDRLGVRWIAEDQPVERKRGLMRRGESSTRGLRVRAGGI